MDQESYCCCNCWKCCDEKILCPRWARNFTDNKYTTCLTTCARLYCVICAWEIACVAKLPTVAEAKQMGSSMPTKPRGECAVFSSSSTVLFDALKQVSSHLAWCLMISGLDYSVVLWNIYILVYGYIFLSLLALAILANCPFWCLFPLDSRPNGQRVRGYTHHIISIHSLLLLALNDW